MIRVVSPVFFKELAQIANGARSMVLRCIFLALLWVIYAFIVGNSNDWGGGSQIGVSSFGFVIFAQLVAVALFTPIIAGGTIAGERQAGTLGLLFLTRLTTWHMVQDKGLSRIVQLTWLCLLAFPFLFGSLLFGGIELRQVIVCLGHVLATILMCGGISLACSVLFKRYAAVLAAAYTAEVLWFTIMPIPVYHLFDSVLRIDTGIAWFSPFVGCAMMMDYSTMTMAPHLSYACLGTIGVGLVVYFAAIAFGALALRSVAFPGAIARKGWGRALETMCRPVWKARQRLLGDRNPVSWKQQHFGHGYLVKVLRWLAMILVSVYVIFTIMIMLDRGGYFFRNNAEYHVVWFIPAVAITGIFTVLVAAGSYGYERESGTFDLLLSTRLPGPRLAAGMLKGGLRSIAPLWIPAIVLGVLTRITESLPGTFAVVFFLIYYLVLLVMLSQVLSLNTSSTPMAIGLTLAVVLGITFGFPFLGMLMAIGTHDEQIAEFFVALSPGTWLVALALDHNDLMDEIGDWPALVVVAFVYGAFATVLWKSAANRFDRIVNRQPTTGKDGA